MATVVILRANDIHGQLTGWTGWKGDLTDTTVGGFEVELQDPVPAVKALSAEVGNRHDRDGRSVCSACDGGTTRRHGQRLQRRDFDRRYSRIGAPPACAGEFRL